MAIPDAGAIMERFPGVAPEDRSGGLDVIVVPKDKIPGIAEFLKNDPSQNYNFLSDITCVDYLNMRASLGAFYNPSGGGLRPISGHPERKERFEIIYNLYSIPRRFRVFLKVYMDEKDLELESVTPVWKGADWFEREVYDMFGIKFKNHPDLRRILMPSAWKGHPLRKDYPIGGEEVAFTANKDMIDPQEVDIKELSIGDDEIYAALMLNLGGGTRLSTIKGDEPVKRESGEWRTILNLGPQHPSTHGLLRLVLDLEGERIKKVMPIIGYLHTGIEKNCEQLTYQKALTLTDRVDYLTPLSNNLAYCLAVERLMDIDIPLRAQYARVILCELSRIASHLVYLAAQGLDVGVMSLFFYCFNERELIQDIFEYISGVRMMTSYINIGGLRYDLQEGFKDKVAAFIDRFSSKIDEFEELLTDNPIWIKRAKGIGMLSPEDAINYSVSGPSLRASGVNWDVRKAAPYSCYDHFDFTVPLGEKGDVFDRYVVRVEEMRQSLNIIRQALATLPDGPCRSQDRKIITPPKKELAKSMEAVIHHFLISSAGFPVPKGEAYSSIESPRGEVGYYVVSDGSGKPYRVRIRGASFANLQAISRVSEGFMIADLIAIIGSFDPVLGEVDR
ncbi:MAG TPA: NADH dehydrogenase (quinone) subunit D [Nitrospiria bacterium]|nr:NADH dehydrogenase (quinone) subunit D [Nitrospiria bacterium]